MSKERLAPRGRRTSNKTSVFALTVLLSVPLASARAFSSDQEGTPRVAQASASACPASNQTAVEAWLSGGAVTAHPPPGYASLPSFQAADWAIVDSSRPEGSRIRHELLRDMRADADFNEWLSSQRVRLDEEWLELKFEALSIGRGSARVNPRSGETAVALPFFVLARVRTRSMLYAMKLQIPGLLVLRGSARSRPQTAFCSQPGVLNLPEMRFASGIARAVVERHFDQNPDDARAALALGGIPRF